VKEMKIIIIIILILLITNIKNERKRILITPMPAYSHYQNMEQFADYLTKNYNETYEITFLSVRTKIKNLGEYIKEFGNKEIKYIDCGEPKTLFDPDNQNPQAMIDMNVRLFNCLHENKVEADMYLVEVLFGGVIDYCFEKNIKTMLFVPAYTSFSSRITLPIYHLNLPFTMFYEKIEKIFDINMKSRNIIYLWINR
jgi:hypothetical protein